LSDSYLNSDFNLWLKNDFKQTSVLKQKLQCWKAGQVWRVLLIFTPKLQIDPFLHKTLLKLFCRKYTGLETSMEILAFNIFSWLFQIF